MLNPSRPPSDGPAAFARMCEALTWREREVLELICRPMSNSDIATELYLSPNTVKTYVRQLFTKLNVNNRAQLIVWAFRAGVVAPGQGPSASGAVRPGRTG